MLASTAEITNQLLGMLPAASQNRVRPYLNDCELKHGSVLFEVGGAIKYLTFPGEHAMVSLISVNELGELTEVGVAGREGVIGFSGLLGSEESSHRALVQIPGRALRMKIDKARELFSNDGDFRAAILRYLNFMLLQLSQTALCNRLHTVEERLARWLLMSDDRAQKDELPLTHEMLGHMLGTRRATVTLAAAVFQDAGLIRYQRGRITIQNRRKLQEAACACFSAHEKNLRWLLGRK